MGLWSISQLAHLVPGTRPGQDPAALSPPPGVPPSQVPVWPLPLPGPKVTSSEWSSLETLCTITILAPPPIPPRHFRHPTGYFLVCLSPTRPCRGLAPDSRVWHQQAASCGHQRYSSCPVVLWVAPPEDTDLISRASSPLASLHSQWAPASAPHTWAPPPLRHRGPAPTCSAPQAPDGLPTSLSQVPSPPSSHSGAGTQAGNLSGGSRVSGKYKSDRKVCLPVEKRERDSLPFLSFSLEI